MTIKEEIEVKKLEIELEKIKMKKYKILHENKMKELEIKKEIAKLYRSKKKRK